MADLKPGLPMIPRENEEHVLPVWRVEAEWRLRNGPGFDNPMNQASRILYLLKRLEEEKAEARHWREKYESQPRPQPWMSER